MSSLSRRKVANYVADQYVSGASLDMLMSEVAAYLIETKSVRLADVMVRDIEDALADRGVVVARVKTARELTPGLRQRIDNLIGAKKTHVEATVDPSLIGGIVLETPGHRLDASIRQKLNALQHARQ